MDVTDLGLAVLQHAQPDIALTIDRSMAGVMLAGLSVTCVSKHNPYVHEYARLSLDYLVTGLSTTVIIEGL